MAKKSKKRSAPRRATAPDLTVVASEVHNLRQQVKELVAVVDIQGKALVSYETWAKAVTTDLQTLFSNDKVLAGALERHGHIVGTGIALPNYPR
jgi:hypothetical protein